MPQYKVIYFNVMALAEPMRFLLSYGNIDFEDVRIDRADWPALKPTMPMGQMPVLEVDGKRAHQSVAINRYLAKVVGLTGSDAWEDLEIDTVVDTINDLRLKLSVVAYENDEEVKAKKMEILESETIPFFMEKLDYIAKENGGYFAVGKLTWADIYFAAVLPYLNSMAKKDVTESYPNVKQVVDKVLEIESIKKWVAKRPITDV